MNGPGASSSSLPAVAFGVVVFDEASPIRVADAVGAMGRARSVVVVGGSKQMPPTSFGGVGLDDTDAEVDDEVDAGVPEDEESILSECVQARVPRRWPSWHYRSQDEALIVFSRGTTTRAGSPPPPTPVCTRTASALRQQVRPA